MTEQQTSGDTTFETNLEPLPPRTVGRSTGSVKVEVGVRLEAQDLYKNWYQAKVVEVDNENREVLIHFEGWNHRHDEWIAYDSPRLRPVSSEEKQDARVKISNRGFQIQPRIRVEARWKSIGYFPGTVLTVNDDDSCQILFDDGIEMKVMRHHIRMPRKQPKAPPVPYPATTTEKVKQERQASLAEARRQRAIRRNSDGHPQSEPSSPLSPEPKRRKCDMSESMSPTEHLTVAEMALPTLPVEPSTSPLSHSPQHSSSFSHPEPSLQSTEPTQSFTPQVPVPSMVPMMNDKQPHREHQPPAQPPVSALTSCTTVATPTQPLPKPIIKGSTRTEPFLTRSKTKAAESKSENPASNYFAPKEWVVVLDHNKYKCMVAGCDKAFRKASLLNYHVKYYHSEAQPESPRKKQKVMGSRPRDVSLSESDAVLPQSNSCVNINQTTPQSVETETVKVKIETSVSASPVKEKKGIERPHFVLSGRHPHEQLQPIHKQERRKFEKRHSWYWCGDMGVVNRMTGCVGGAVKQLCSILTACHNDLAADVTAVNEVLRSLDVKLDMMKNPKLHIKGWTENGSRRGETSSRSVDEDGGGRGKSEEPREEKQIRTATDDQKQQQAKDRQVSTTESRWEGQQVEQQWEEDEEAEEEEEEENVFIDVEEHKQESGNTDHLLGRMDDNLVASEKDEAVLCHSDSSEDDVRLILQPDFPFNLSEEKESPSSREHVWREDAVANQNVEHGELVSQNTTVSKQTGYGRPLSPLPSKNVEHTDSFVGEVIGQVDCTTSPGSSGSSTLTDTSDNAEMTDSLLHSQSEGCKVYAEEEEDDILDVTVTQKARLLSEIERMQTELEERMDLLESQLSALDGGDAETLESLKKMADRIERTLQTEAQ